MLLTIKVLALKTAVAVLDAIARRLPAHPAEDLPAAIAKAKKMIERLWSYRPYAPEAALTDAEAVLDRLWMLMGGASLAWEHAPEAALTDAEAVLDRLWMLMGGALSRSREASLAWEHLRAVIDDQRRKARLAEPAFVRFVQEAQRMHYAPGARGLTAAEIATLHARRFGPKQREN